MIGVQWDKGFLQQQLDAIQRGEALQADQWDGHSLLMTAGALFFAAMSHGPQAYQNIDWDKLPLERREAASETFYSDLHNAVEWLAEMAMQVRDGNYEENFADHAGAVLYGDDENSKKMLPIFGFHNQDDQL